MIGKIIGSSSYASQLDLASPLEKNAEEVYGRVFQFIRFGLRNYPFDPTGDPPADSINYMVSGLTDLKFKVLGKHLINQKYLWYYVELLNDEDDWRCEIPDEETGQFEGCSPEKGLKAGKRVFIYSRLLEGTKPAGAEPIITVKWKKFFRDLLAQNKEFASSGDESQNDTLRERITRFRQRGHNKDVDLFDKVIGHTVEDPVYLDEIPYDGGESVQVSYEKPDGTEGVISVDTSIQLYKDYSCVEFSNKTIAEIQHLFVGLDVIDYLNEDFKIFYGIIPIEVPNNIHWSLFCGDAGSVSADTVDPEKKEDIKKATTSYLKHIAGYKQVGLIDLFHSVRLSLFPIEDMLGDIYCFGLNKIKRDLGSPEELPGPVISEIFSIFNHFLNSGFEKECIDELYKTIGLNTNSVFTEHPSVISNTISFSKTWYLRSHPIEGMSQNTKDRLAKFSEDAIRTFSYFVVEKIRKKYY